MENLVVVEVQVRDGAVDLEHIGERDSAGRGDVTVAQQHGSALVVLLQCLCNRGCELIGGDLEERAARELARGEGGIVGLEALDRGSRELEASVSCRLKRLASKARTMAMVVSLGTEQVANDPRHQRPELGDTGHRVTGT